MEGAGERWSLIFRVIKTFIPIEPDVAVEVNDPMYRFVSTAQVEAGRVAPTAKELKAFAKNQSAKSRGAHNRIHGDVQKSMAGSQALGTKHDRRLHILTLSVIAL